MTLLIAARRKVWHPENLRQVLKVNASEQNAKSKCRQITSPGSVFFLGCYSVKAGNADKGPGLRGHSLSSKKCRLCICTYHKARGIFDVWRKWILERPADILKKKSFPFLKNHHGLLLPASLSHQRENIPQCPGQWQQFSSQTDYINIMYSPGKISTAESTLLFTTSRLSFLLQHTWSVVQGRKIHLLHHSSGVLLPMLQ